MAVTANFKNTNKDSKCYKIITPLWYELFKVNPPFGDCRQAKDFLASNIPLPVKVSDNEKLVNITDREENRTANNKQGKNNELWYIPGYFPLKQKFKDFLTMSPDKVVKWRDLEKPDTVKELAVYLIDRWAQNFTQTANKIIDSKNVFYSDNVYTSYNVWNSAYVFNSKNIIFSRQIGGSKNLIASYNSDSSANSIRLAESVNCSYTFNVFWSNKVSRSMFIYNGYDLYECMFSSNIYSKKYCIANIEFPPEKYFEIKAQIINLLSKNNWQVLRVLIGAHNFNIS